MNKKMLAVAAFMASLLPACRNRMVGQIPENATKPETIFIINETESSSASAIQKWTQEERDIIALTLAGECYEDKERDKRLVCEVILNRVSDGGFGGSSVREVLEAEKQFKGYWYQSRPVSENDKAIAAKTLEDWYKNDCEPLSEFLYFQAGENRENVFY